MGTIIFQSAESICIDLGERLRRLRLAQNLTQTQLAQMTNSSISSIRRLEGKGQTTLELMVRVTQALQRTDQLECLFEQPVQSIAQAERAQVTALRQRARLPAPVR